MIIDDIKFSNDPRSIMYGEKAGLAFAPVGIYDFANKLEYTTETDFNGIYDVLMPSTNHISCPTPSGVCANMYRFVANDPGIPGRLNPNYKPGYATHAAGAEAIPGVSTFADLAPTPVGLQVESPATGLQQQVICAIDSVTPQLFTVSQPYIKGSGTFTINGFGFGATKGAGQVTLDGTIVLPTTAWGAQQIVVTVPPGTPTGPHQLSITANNGQSTVNGLTFHVLPGGVQPVPGRCGPRQLQPQHEQRLSDSRAPTTGAVAASLLANLFRITPSTPASEANQAQVRAVLGGNVYWSAGSAFGADQDAYFTFRKAVASGNSREGGVLLKVGTTTTTISGSRSRPSRASSASPTSLAAAWWWQRRAPPARPGAPCRRRRFPASRSPPATDWERGHSQTAP